MVSASMCFHKRFLEDSFCGRLVDIWVASFFEAIKKAPEIRGFSLARWWRRRELNPMPHLFNGPQKTTIAHKTNAYKNDVPHITTQNRSGVDTSSTPWFMALYMIFLDWGSFQLLKAERCRVCEDGSGIFSRGCFLLSFQAELRLLSRFYCNQSWNVIIVVTFNHQTDRVELNFNFIELAMLVGAGSSPGPANLLPTSNE